MPGKHVKEGIMPAVNIQKVKDPSSQNLPVFADIAQRFDAVRQRAHELFESRGGEVGRALDDWFTAERELFGWTAAELSEKGNSYEIQFTLAGFDPKEVQVTATPAEIVVRAAAKEESKGEKGSVLWSEFGSKDVCRRFELPGPINTDKVTALLDKGVLRVQAPKAVAAKEKDVIVGAAA
jgi:HSP20 family protein